MLSRDADACYWIGRYVERAEATARMVDVHYHASLESGRSVLRWSALLAAAGGPDAPEIDDRAAFHWFAFDEENPDAIVPVWLKARENARTIREQLSSEMWEGLNVAWLDLRTWSADRMLETSPNAFFTRVRHASHLFQGVLNRTMLFGEAREWLDVGRFLERSCQTVRQLDVRHHDLLPTAPVSDDPTPYGAGGPLEMHGWIAALRSVSGLEMYRKVHRSGIRPEGIVDFLILDNRFPASVRHGVGRVESCLRRIGRNPSGPPACEAERQAGRMVADLTYTDTQAVLEEGLHAFLVRSAARLETIGDAVSDDYLRP